MHHPNLPAPARGMACNEVEGGATSGLWGGPRAEGGQGLTRATWKGLRTVHLTGYGLQSEAQGLLSRVRCRR